MRAILVNPPTPKTFWSFEEALKITGKSAVLPPLGLLTVASLLPTDWDLELADLNFQTISEQDWDECDLVLITGMSVQRTGILQSIREAKKRGKIVAVGGAWAFHSPEAALAEGADYAVVGEGEVTVKNLLHHLHKKESGLIIRADSMADLENSPLPRYDLLDADSYLNMAMQFSRGCPFQCEFCDVTLMFGRRMRTKRPEQILAELQAIHDIGRWRYIFVVDDNFVGSPVKAKELLREIISWQKSRGWPFELYTQASVNMAADDELLDLMVEAGFYKVFLGIESLDEESLKNARKYQNVATDLELACDKINRAGMGIIAGCIVGFDNERPAADQRLIDFAARTHIPEMFVSLLQAAEGTDLWHRLQKEGRLFHDGDVDAFGNQTTLMNFEPTRPIGQVVSEFVHTYDTLYSREAYLERSFQHVMNMNPRKIRKRTALPRFFELTALLKVLVKHGILFQSRRKFWQYLLTILWKRPDQAGRFIDYTVAGEHYSDYGQTISRQFQQHLPDCTAPAEDSA